jgi:hypothetical protein
VNPLSGAYEVRDTIRYFSSKRALPAGVFNNGTPAIIKDLKKHSSPVRRLAQYDGT